MENVKEDFESYEASDDSAKWIEENCLKIKSWQMAAKENNTYGLHLMALCLKFGCGVKKNEHETFKHFMKAGELGLPNSQFNLGFCYANGEGVEENKEEAIKWYLLAANNGHCRAQFELGFCYANGQGVEQNDKQSAYWIYKSAEQGDKEAQTIVGHLFNYGNVFKEDKTEALKWYRKAAEQGDFEAQKVLGDFYYDGLGIKENKQEAAKWYLRAANQGYAPAQYNLGVCFAYGQGVQADKKEALKWYCEAADQGFQEAIKAAEDIQKEISKIKKKDLPGQKIANSMSAFQVAIGALCYQNWAIQEVGEPGSRLNLGMIRAFESGLKGESVNTLADLEACLETYQADYHLPFQKVFKSIDNSKPLLKTLIHESKEKHKDFEDSSGRKFSKKLSIPLLLIEKYFNVVDFDDSELLENSLFFEAMIALSFEAGLRCHFETPDLAVKIGEEPL